MKNVRYSRSYPKAFGKLVDKLAAPAFKKRGFGQARVLTDWPAIVGHDIAAYCSPQRVAGDRFGKHGSSLHVAVLPAFALHLQQQEPIILERIATYYGYRAVHKLVLHQTHELPSPEKASKAPPPELDAQSQHELDTLTAEVEDDALQAALRKLGASMKQKQASLAKPDSDA